MSDTPALKPLIWIGSSRKDFGVFADPVKDRMGYALYIAQRGGKHADAKPLKGYGDAGLIEIVRDYHGDGVVYVLHVFQKKSKRGHETPKVDIDLIDRRLREAERIAKEQRP